MFSKSKKLLLFLPIYLLLVACSVVLFGLGNKALASGPWGCGDSNTKWINGGVLQVCDDFFVFDPGRSASQQTPVFVSADRADSDGDHKPVFTITIGTDASGKFGTVLRDTAGNTTSLAFLADNAKASDPFKATNGAVYCSVSNPTNCFPYDGTPTGIKNPHGTELDSNFSGGFTQIWGYQQNKSFTASTYDPQKWIDALKGQAQNEEKNTNCQQNAGTLGFLFCPLFDSVSNSIQQIVGVSPNGTVNTSAPLISLLIVQPLQFGGNNNTLQTANQNIVAIANALYVLLFIIIIFANFIDFGLDNYTIKRLLPRLVAAIILTQFSYLICAFIIDAGNALGVILPQLIASASGATNANPIQNALTNLMIIGSGNNLTTILTGIGGFLILLIFVIAILVVLLIALVYMIFRLFGIYLLVLAAPIAIAASVLPATNKYSRMWIENLIKLSLMFPLVTAVIAVSGVVSNILITAGQSGNDKLLQLAGSIVPLLALLLIPKCLKWSGGIMSYAAGAVTGYLAGKGKQAGSIAGEKYGAQKEQRQQRIAAGSGRLLGRGKRDEKGNLVKPSLRRRLAAGSGFRNRPKNTLDYASKQQAALKPWADAANLATDAQLAQMLKSRNSLTRAAGAMSLMNRGQGGKVFQAYRDGNIKDSDFDLINRYDRGAFEKTPMLRDSKWRGGTTTGRQEYFQGLNAESIVSMGKEAQQHVVIDNWDQLTAETQRQLQTDRYLGRMDSSTAEAARGSTVGGTGHAPTGYDPTNNPFNS